MSTTQRIEMDYLAPPQARVLQRRALLVGIVFGAASILGAILMPAQAMRSYLLGFMWCLGMSLGCLAFLMLQHLTGGSWGMVIRRILEAGSRNISLMVLLFIPIVIGMRSLYEWTDPAKFANDAHLKHITEMYLTPKYFIFRAALYFIAWVFMAEFLNRWSHLHDEPPDRDLSPRFRGVSGPGLVVYGFTVTFAAVDWVMSLDPHWASTIYGLLFVAGQGLSGICIAVVMAVALAQYQPMRSFLKPANLRDYGNLMLTFVMLWAYFSFSQWLITWSANLPDEIRWYMPRTHHGWNYVGFVLVLFHFAVPFALLLSRNFKFNPRTLVMLAVWLLMMRWLDLLWMIEPNFNKEAFHLSWLDFVVPIAMLGFWVALFFWNLRRKPLVPLHDPRAIAMLESEIG
jgi:hypothetical protein